MRVLLGVPGSPEDGTPYHEGELLVQRRAGVVAGAAKVGRGIHPEIPSIAAEFLAQRAYVVIGGEDDRGDVWSSLIAGPPGFAIATDPQRVQLRHGPLRADPLERLEAGQSLGLLAIDLATRRRMRVNGRVHSAGPPLLLDVTEAYSNCPKYIQARVVDVGAGSETGEVTVGAKLSEDLRALLATADTFFIATIHRERGADASHRGGPPGFVAVDADGALIWPDYAGNMMFNTLGNLTLDSRAGLLFPDFARGRTVQLSGTAAVDWDRDVSDVPGAQRFVRFVPERVVIRTGVLAEAAFLGWSPHNPTSA